VRNHAVPFDALWCRNGYVANLTPPEASMIDLRSDSDTLH